VECKLTENRGLFITMLEIIAFYINTGLVIQRQKPVVSQWGVGAGSAKRCCGPIQKVLGIDPSRFSTS